MKLILILSVFLIDSCLKQLEQFNAFSHTQPENQTIGLQDTEVARNRSVELIYNDDEKH